MTILTETLASRFARIALGHVGREWPNKLDHVLAGPDDVQGPRDLHPLFYGSFDWHSCVHGYWLLARILRRFPELPEAAAIRAQFNSQLTTKNVAAEIDYLAKQTSRGFERPYGWAWALMFASELSQHEAPEGKRWSGLVAPLAQTFEERFYGWFPVATYPVRAGVHGNTSFALLLALEYAHAFKNTAFAAALCEKAMGWYANDSNCQVWEPCGDDFLSPALIEAACMRAVLDGDGFAPWLARFLPGLSRGEPMTLFSPASVSDRSDGKIAHLDGLNLSRAWCWGLIADGIATGETRTRIEITIAQHLQNALPHVTGDYMGEHWLASFALLALDHTLPLTPHRG